MSLVMYFEIEYSSLFLKHVKDFDRIDNFLVIRYYRRAAYQLCAVESFAQSKYSTYNLYLKVSVLLLVTGVSDS